MQITCYILLGRGTKRPLSSPVREVEKPDIEVWALTDVVFVEDIRSVPIGRVLKVSDSLTSNPVVHQITVILV